jgi:transcription antitermination protein NusB
VVRGVEAAGSELDDMIAAVLAEDHDVERLETVLKVVLRAGAFELSHRLDVPARVTIKEYVDVAEAFYGLKETKLVNAVLDRLARELRPEELEERPGGLSPLAG